MEGFEHVARAFFAEHGMVRHHIDSFNRFVDEGMQTVVDEVGEMVPSIAPAGVNDYRLRFGKIRVEHPVVKEANGERNPLYPTEARLREITYAAPILLELIVERDGMKSDPIEAEVGNLPIMLRSSNCRLTKLDGKQLVENGEDPADPGGYFIINGTERVLIAIEDLRPNMPLLEKRRSGPATDIVRLFSEAPGFRVPHLFERLGDGTIRVSFARISRIPFAILAMALGIESDEEISRCISMDGRLAEDVMVNIEASMDVHKTDDALDWIGRQMKIGQGRDYRIDRVGDLLDNYLLPHIGRSKASRIEKAHYLGKCAEKIMKLHHGFIDEDDKDHYANKRLKLPGELLEQLFRAAFKALLNDMKYSFERITKRGREPPISTIVRSQLFSNRIESALATGYWVGGRTGVSQHLQRLNYMDTLSHLRRVLSPLTTTQPHFAARELHPTHWGKLCSSETPEGQNIGLRKNLALFSKVTYGFEAEGVRKNMIQLGVEGWE